MQSFIFAEQFGTAKRQQRNTIVLVANARLNIYKSTSSQLLTLDADAKQSMTAR